MRRLLQRLLLATGAVWLGACATPPAPAPALPADLFADSRFGPPSAAVDASTLFTVDAPMRRFVQEQVLPAARGGTSRARALLDALYDREKLQLEFDASITRTASQAFESRSGNCLSLLVMTAALAREIGLDVQFRSADIEAHWTRNAELHIARGHVNVTIGTRLPNPHAFGERHLMVVDFLPARELQGLRTRTIDEATVLAMYMNNRAAESLQDGAVDDAYWWARGAIAAAPQFLHAVNTLGLVYRRHGEATLAERAFARVLAAEPWHRHALFNQSQLMAETGRTGEAAALRQRLASVEPQRPFEAFDRGREALQRGDPAAARVLFARELERDGRNPEFHHWLAVAEWRLGDLDAARHHLNQALGHSLNSGERERYAGKLDWLRQQARQ